MAKEALTIDVPTAGKRYFSACAVQPHTTRPREVISR
jgi:hypothetical protein